MAIQTVLMRNKQATAYGQAATYGALSSTAPGTSAGTEISGGSYARIGCSWGTAAAGAVTTQAMAFNVPSGATVAGFEFYDASTAGNYLDGVTVTSQQFSSAGTYTVTATFTAS